MRSRCHEGRKTAQWLLYTPKYPKFQSQIHSNKRVRAWESREREVQGRRIEDASKEREEILGGMDIEGRF